MSDAKREILEDLWKTLSAISGIADSGRISHDEQLYLKIFKKAVENGVRLGSDEIVESISASHGQEMKEGHKKALKDLASAWRHWSFFEENYKNI